MSNELTPVWEFPEFAAMVDNLISMYIEYSGMLGYFDVLEYKWEDLGAGEMFARIRVEDSGEEYLINAATIEKGFENLKNGDLVNAAKKEWIVSRIIRAKAGDEDADDFDLEDADIIIQAGIFGQLVYG